MITINRETLPRWGLFTLIVAVYLWGQWYKLFYLAPPPANIWDNVVLWDWARSFMMGDFSVFENDSHHRLRWANWAFPALLIQVFSDDVLNYYLSSAIPTILASLVFAYFVFRYIGVWQTALFLILWYYDSELFFATFQLMPTSQSLLPISILLMLFTHTVTKGEAGATNTSTPVGTTSKISTPMAVAMSVCIFWLYGVKETYMAFLPAVMWLMWKIGGSQPLKVLGVVFVVGYILETLFFNWISDGFPALGRIYAVANQGSHVKIMLGDPRYVAQQTRFFDSGITMRWAVAVGMSSIAYYTAFLFALLTMAQRQKIPTNTYKPEHIIAVFLLSFMLFTTIFILPVYPIRLGHGLVSRYLAIGLPFSYIIGLWYLTEQIKDNKLWLKLAASLIVLFYVAPAINRFAEYPRSSIAKEALFYRDLGNVINQYDCFRARSLPILSNELTLVPFKFKEPQIHALTRTKDATAEERLYMFKVNEAAECANKYTFSRKSPNRY